MHEVSIAQSILKTVIREHDESMLKKVTAIGVRIGTLSGIMPDALEFGFDSLKKDTVLKNARLAIEIVDVGAVCQNCGHTFGIDNLFFKCPACGSSDIEVERGMELDMAYLELETVEEESEI